ncbi:nucleotidyltransferase family protein [Bifidobacterium stellenboschense]|nr:nucleotidyltransferase domain-containing protein [Bifidobacterium stellenboschense]
MSVSEHVKTADDAPSMAAEHRAEQADLTPGRIASVARPIALRNRVSELYLFGSMARGEGKADSDIDFIYQFAPDANPQIDLIALRDELEHAFGRSVDLVRKTYVTDSQHDRLRELQRVLFANSITSKPMFRIV